MSVQKILYVNKETFQVSPLDEINKATAANYNEIKDVVNFNADELDSIIEGTWVPDLTTGDASAIQNAATSDITGQTTGGGDPTFTFIDSTIDVTSRSSIGEVNFLHFKKTDTGTSSVFKVDIDGIITGRDLIIGDQTDTDFTFGGLRLGSNTRIIRSSATQIDFQINGLTGFDWRMTTNIFQSNFTGGASMRRSPDANNVAYGFFGDVSTGVLRNSAGNFGLYSLGLEALNIDSSQVVTTKSNFIVSDGTNDIFKLFTNGNFLAKDAVGTTIVTSGFLTTRYSNSEDKLQFLAEASNVGFEIDNILGSPILQPITTNADITLRAQGSGGDVNIASSNQKIGHFGVTAVVRQTTTSQTPATFVANSSGISDDTATWNGYTIGDLVAILQAYGLLT